jgi:hypothetical protein
MAKRHNPDPYARRSMRKARVGGETIFKRAHGRGSLNMKDYTQFIRWTPLKIVIFAMCVGVPVIATIVAVATFISPAAALPLVIYLSSVGAIVAIMYKLARTNF